MNGACKGCKGPVGISGGPMLMGGPIGGCMLMGRPMGGCMLMGGPIGGPMLIGGRVWNSPGGSVDGTGLAMAFLR